VRPLDGPRACRGTLRRPTRPSGSPILPPLPRRQPVGCTASRGDVSGGTCHASRLGRGMHCCLLRLSPWSNIYRHERKASDSPFRRCQCPPPFATAARSKTQAPPVRHRPPSGLMAWSLYDPPRRKLVVCGGEARAAVLSSALHTRLGHGAYVLLHAAPHERTHHGEPCTSISGSQRHAPARRDRPPASPPAVRGSRRANHGEKRTATAAPCRHPSFHLGPPGGTMSFRHETA